MNIHGNDKLYVLLDISLKGYITWQERGTVGVLMWTTGGKAERYLTEVYPERLEQLSVCTIRRDRAKDFFDQMLASGIDLAVVDLTPNHVDPLAMNPGEYALLNIEKARAALL